MRVNAKPPVLMPQEHWREFDGLSKAALLDLAWDYAVRCAGEDAALEELRKMVETIKRFRTQPEGT